jgi:Tfp pilus assembly protein PilP
MVNIESFGAEDFEMIGVDMNVTDMFAIVNEQNHYKRMRRTEYNKYVGITDDRK